MRENQTRPAAPLYDPRFEHDACGIGAVVDIKGRKTHQTVDDALKIVEKLEHRAGKDAAGETGDGVGILLQISHGFFSKAAAELGFELGGERDYGVGMFFFPQDDLRRNQAMKMFQLIAEREGMEFIGWREVPVCPQVLGHKALAKMPRIMQGFVRRPDHLARGLEFDRRLYIVRREFEQSGGDTYVASLSSRTIVYKGMFLVGQLREFYQDLQSEAYTSAIALVHSRFSTNTDPAWERAHPNRFILHNGEINTIRGNADRMLAREETMHAPVWEGDLDKVFPVVDVNGSDSAMLDNTLEFLVMSGMDLPLAVMICIPEPRDVHHFAALLGYGARAVNPYLAQETIGQLIDEGLLDKDFGAAVDDYDKAILKGIVKIASKMGISTIQSYQSAQIFEAIGISQDVVHEYFTNTVSRVGGIGLKEIEQLVDKNHSRAFDPLGLGVDMTLDSVGSHKARTGQEDHMYNPQTIHLLQQSARTGDYNLFKQYSALVDDETCPHTLRGLMEMKYADEPIPIDQVESVDSIVKRFKTGAMSYGSISQEAHECMAVAMNMLGGKSNSGEGGERPERLKSDRCSAIKQVASGRFGVTSEYLVSAKEIQIKMAQGAKPGEGGHLPGKKVYPWIAKTRYSTPGVSLISPPPHHDIYSIEDLAQLIYDLKNANRQARISVKLVSEAGVGTVAAGVAKAGAQVVLISGWDGGTGAAPRTSIHNAGLPWELGLAETHQTLIQNGLRSRVVLETDGKLMTGRDVAIACMLGAEEFGFATAPLVTMGCVMMRVCNLDTCPVGVATQNPELRKRFKGKPEYVVNFMRFIAQELREHMAKLGVRTVEELVGRTDLLKQRESAVNDRAAAVDLSAILDDPYIGEDYKTHFDPADVYDFQLEKTVDQSILLAKMGSALKKGQKKRLSLEVTSTDRAVGTIFGSDITRLHGEGLEEDAYTVHCTGGGGQSFGAFIPKGLTLELEGDSNDYFGKGLSGGKLVVYPPKNASYQADENIIVGNVALYGATSGKAFIAGVAGERFAVRNSGACAVVEGVGDHGCEYMTGGRVVVLGETGKNFAAGMSGGIAYVWDPRRDLYLRVNKELVSMEPVIEKHDLEELRSLIAQHVEATGSEKGKAILADFQHSAASFKKILPRDYDRILKAIAQFEERGMSHDEAEIEAFYAVTGGAREWESPLDFWNTAVRVTPASRLWSGLSTGTSSTPCSPRRNGESREPGAWSAACPSASPGWSWRVCSPAVPSTTWYRSGTI